MHSLNNQSLLVFLPERKDKKEIIRSVMSFMLMKEKLLLVNVKIKILHQILSKYLSLIYTGI